MFSVLSTWLSFFSTLSLVLLIIVAVFMVIVILMQRPKQEGLGAAFGGGMTNQMFGAHTTNVLEKFTFKLAIIFIVLCFARSIFLAKLNKGVSLISEQPVAEQQVTEDNLENIVEQVKKELEEAKGNTENNSEASSADSVIETAEQIKEEASQAASEVVENAENKAAETAEAAKSLLTE